MEREAVRIEFGGGIPENAVEEIGDAAERGGFSFEWNGAAVEANDVCVAIDCAAETRGKIVLHRGDAPAGMVPDLVEVLRNHGVVNRIRRQHPDTGKTEYEFFDGYAVNAKNAETARIPAISIEDAPAPGW